MSKLANFDQAQGFSCKPPSLAISSGPFSCSIPKTDDESKVHPGYVMRAESPAAAENWADVLNRIRLLKDETEDDVPARKAEERVCFCFWKTKPNQSNFDATEKLGDKSIL